MSNLMLTVPNMTEQLSRALWRGIVACARFAPCSTMAILIYAGLRSSAIYPAATPEVSWHPGFLNIGDVLLVAGMFIDGCRRRFTMRVGIFAMLAYGVFILSLSFVNTHFPQGAFFDGLLCWLRFAAIFTWALWIARRVGQQAVEAILILVFFVTATSALFVSSLTVGFYRMFGSAMSVASFAQLVTAVALIALVRCRPWVLATAMVYLVLTFSNTCWVSFCLLAVLLFAMSKPTDSRGGYGKALLIVLGLVIATWALAPQLASQHYPVNRVFSSGSYQDLNGRTSIWNYGLSLAQDHQFSWLGNGYNTSPSVLAAFGVPADAGRFVAPSSFHNIELELAWGLGAPALFFGGLLAHRIVSSYLHRRQLSLVLFSLFAITQTVDFTFCTPKALLIWAIILGIAEAAHQAETPPIRALPQLTQPFPRNEFVPC